MEYLPISVAVITIQGREIALEKLLAHLNTSFLHYPGECELVICNNSDNSYVAQIEKTISTTKTDDFCSLRIIQSPENNIAVARNLLFKETSHRMLAFIDDDEYPTEKWLTALFDTMKNKETHVVAGPVISNYPNTTAPWIVNADIHNVEPRIDGERIQYAATCNLLIDKPSVPEPVFNTDFGKSGGSDTEFFERNVRVGMIVRWATDALVYEDVESSRANSRFIIRRFMVQGQVFRQIKTLHGTIPSQFLFALKAWMAGVMSLLIATMLFILRRKTLGLWLKRAFFNFGKVMKSRKLLYE